MTPFGSPVKGLLALKAKITVFPNSVSYNKVFTLKEKLGNFNSTILSVTKADLSLLIQITGS